METSTIQKSDQRDLFLVLRELSKQIRMFQRDNVYCEGLTFTQFCILDLIVERKGQVELADLHGLLSVDKSTTTRLVEPLMKRKLLLKLRSDRDTRATRLELTPEGLRIRNEYWNCMERNIDVMLAGIPGQKRKEMNEFMKKFVHAFGCCTGGGNICF